MQKYTPPNYIWWNKNKILWKEKRRRTCFFRGFSEKIPVCLIKYFRSISRLLWNELDLDMECFHMKYSRSKISRKIRTKSGTACKYVTFRCRSKNQILRGLTRSFYGMVGLLLSLWRKMSKKKPRGIYVSLNNLRMIYIEFELTSQPT